MKSVLILCLAGWAAAGAMVGAPANRMSLAGRWRFALDANHEGVQKEYFKRDLPERIPLPGSTDEARFGTPNPNKPTLDGLYRLYLYEGPAWYQRDVDIPAAWRGKRVTLFLERTHWETRVWFDGQPLGMQDSLTGKLTRLGTFEASLAKAHAPAKLNVSVALPGTPFANDWDIWVYATGEAPAAPAGVAVVRQWADAAKALAEGRKVLLFPARVNPAKSRPGRFLPVFWSSVWFPNREPSTMGILCDPKHPALAQFPTESYSNWQWYDLVQKSRSIILDETPAGFRPIVQVMDTFERNGKLGNLFEARVGPGRLLVSTMDLPGIAEKQPAARQMLRSLYAYMSSAAFHPTQELDGDLLADIFGSGTR